MRRTFAEVLREGKIEIEDEYRELYRLVYFPPSSSCPLRSIIKSVFRYFPFRGTCVDLFDFDRKYGFQVETMPETVDEECLVTFSEYYYNFIVALEKLQRERDDIPPVDEIYKNQIDAIVEELGYMKVQDEDGIITFVVKDPGAVAVAESEIIPQSLSYRVLEYNHHSWKGNIEKKKQALLMFAEILEPQRAELQSISKELCDDVFFAFNNMNIRHNNIAQSTPSKYRKVIAMMEAEEMEKWYDEVYQMCLLACLELANVERKNKFSQFKEQMLR